MFRAAFSLRPRYGTISLHPQQPIPRLRDLHRQNSHRPSAPSADHNGIITPTFPVLPSTPSHATLLRTIKAPIGHPVKRVAFFLQASCQSKQPGFPARVVPLTRYPISTAFFTASSIFRHVVFEIMMNPDPSMCSSHQCDTF